MPDGEKNFNVRLRFTTEDTGAKQAGQALENVQKGAKEGDKGVKGLGDSLRNVGKTSDAIKTVGTTLSVSFGAMSAGLLSSARAYVNSVQTGETSSRRWLGSTHSISESNLRIGRVIASEVVPWLERAASIYERIAAFAEKNPKLVGTLTVGATGLAAAGVGTLAIGQLLSAISKIGTLFGGASIFRTVVTAATAAGTGTAAATGTGAAAAGAAGAAGAGGAAAATGTTLLGGILSGALGVGIGVAVNNAIARSNWGQQNGFQPFNRFLTVGAYGLGNAVGGQQTGLNWARTIGDLTGAFRENEQAATNDADAVSESSSEIDATSQQIATYIAYIRQEQQAERQRTISLQRMNRDYQRQAQIDTQDFNKQRSRSLRDFHRSEMYTEADYYRQRAIKARDYGIEIVRAEEDFQKSRKRAQEDYQFELWDILRSGDALAYMRANRQYEISRSRAAEDYQIQMSRRSEDFSRELADSEREFQISRKRRLEEFNIQLADEEKDFKIRRERARTQFEIQLADESQDYSEQRLLRRQALQDQMRDLTSGLEQERLLRLEFSRAMLADLQAAVNAAESGRNLITTTAISGHRALGGYVADGLYMMHNREFVMNPATTQAAERIAGGNLDQSTILGLLAANNNSGRNTQRQVVWNDHRVFSSAVSPEEREWIHNDTLATITEVMDGS